jgi:hypothetical protein
MKLSELFESAPITSPSGAAVTTYFETGQGSKYLLSAKNESKRWKSSHANTGGDDQGAKRWYGQCVFVRDEFKYEANSIQFLTGNGINISDITISTNATKVAIYIRKDNKWAIATWDDAYPKSKKGPKPLSFDFVKVPAVGLSCAEFTVDSNHRLKDYHYGSEVTKVLPIDKADQADINMVMGTK